MDIISRIRVIQSGKSVSALAREIGVPQKTLDHVVKGERKPSLALLVLICRRYNVSADWLLGLSDSMSPAPAQTTVNSYNRHGGDCASCPLAQAAARFLAAGVTADKQEEKKSLTNQKNAMSNS